MLNAILQDKDGKEVLSIELPTNPSELKLSRYIDFLKAQEGSENAVKRAVLSISAISGVDYGEMLDAQVGGIYSSATNLDGTLAPVFAHIYKVIGMVTPKQRTEADCDFEYKGEQYKIPFIQQIALSGVDVMPGISVIEAIEVLETKRIAEQLQTEDTTGSVLFSMYLRTMAAICRKEGEGLPIEEGEKERFLSDRMKHFSDIDCQTALDVAFFLSSTLQGLGAKADVFTFLSRLCLIQILEMRVCKPKRKPKQQNTTKRSLPV